MAQEKVTIDLIINAANSATTLKEVKQSVKDITAELQKTTVGSENYNKLALALGKAKAEMKDFKEQIRAFDPDAKFGSFAKVTSGLAGGLQAATGAMALFGVESEEVQKTLLKVQAATALAQGIKSVEELGDAFKTLNTIVKQNPLLAIVTVLTTIGALLYQYKDAIFGVSEEQKELNKELEKQHKITEALKKSSQQQIELLQAQGKKEEEIIAIKKQLINQQVKELQVSILLQENKLKEAATNDTLWESANRLLAGEAAYQITKLTSINEQKKKLEELQVQKQDLNHQIKVLNAQEVVLEEKKTENLITQWNKQKDERDKYFKDLEARWKDFETFSVDGQKKLADDSLVIQDKYQQDAFELFDENAKKTLEQEKAIADAKKSIQQDSFSALTSLGVIFINNAKKLEKFNKGLAVTQILVDTAQAISALVKNSEANPANAITGGVAGIAQFASGIARILANIAKAKQLLSKAGETPSISLSGGGGGGGNTGGGVPLNPVTSNSTLLNPDGTPVIEKENKDNRVYVLETDITDSQKKVASIKNKATFE